MRLLRVLGRGAEPLLDRLLPGLFLRLSDSKEPVRVLAQDALVRVPTQRVVRVLESQWGFTPFTIRGLRIAVRRWRSRAA